MPSISDFYTRTKANTGQRVYLLGPDRSPTEQWIHILHTDSDAYRNSISETLQKIAATAAIADEAARKAAQAELSSEAMAALVTGWSFDEECTRENVKQLLKEAPYIADLIDRKAADAQLFFGKGSSGSSSLQQETPDSKSVKKTDEASEST